MSEKEPQYNHDQTRQNLTKFQEKLPPKEKALARLEQLRVTFLDEIKNNPQFDGYKGQEELIENIFKVWRQDIENGRRIPYTYDDIVEMINKGASELSMWSPTRNVIKITPNSSIRQQVSDTMKHHKKLFVIYDEINRSLKETNS